MYVPPPIVSRQRQVQSLKVLETGELLTTGIRDLGAVQIQTTNVTVDWILPCGRGGVPERKVDE